MVTVATQRKQNRTAYHFFLANAGYSYDPTKQTPMQGRIACARSLAYAERRAQMLGCSFQWAVDPEIDSSEFSDEVPAWQLWTCVARTAEGDVFASLCGIDFGRDVEPWGQAYRRVVEAELACELPVAD